MIPEDFQPRLRRFACFGVATASLFAFPLYQWVRFCLTEDLFSYALLIPFVSGWLIRQQWRELTFRYQPSNAAAVGLAVMRVQPSVWSSAQEAYLAELYVAPDHRGEGHGRELMTEALRLARDRGADYALVVTSEDDQRAQRLYEAAGFRRTEGEGGPVMLAYEREL